MGNLESHAHTGALGEFVLALAPAGFLRDEFENTNHACGVEIGFRGIGRGCARWNARRAEKIQTKLNGIFSGSVRKLVSERLEDPRKGVAARRTQSVRWHAKRHQRSAEEKVLQESAGKFIPRNIGRRSKLLGF